MSRFSGKFDLYDDICLLESPSLNELECFEIFKKKTNGTIYQFISFILTRNNIEEECKNNPNLKQFITTEKKSDSRCKSGYRYIKKYSYEYDGKKYKSLNDINKVGYSRLKEIHFDTLLDIIPYYPYIISMEYSSKNSATIVISNQSYVDQMEMELIRSGINSNGYSRYRHLLQMHYKDVIKKYY